MKNILVCFFCLLSVSLSAQQLKVPALSPRSEIKQEVGLTEITISYARPKAQGRTIFGDLVPYGATWRTGANAPTKLTFSTDVDIADHAVPAGTYALYTIPDAEEWTIIIHKKTKLRVIAGDLVKPENDVCRFKVKSVVSPLKRESLTMQFVEMHTKGVSIELAWENTIVRFPIMVDVDKKMEEAIALLLQDKESISPRDYYFAAEYYLHNKNNKKDIRKAVSWLDAALVKSPNNFRHGLLKAKLFLAQGKKKKAVKTAKQAHQWALDAKNTNYVGLTSNFLEGM